MQQLMATAPDLDAVVVGSDLMAAGALGVLAAKGLSVPSDVVGGGTTMDITVPTTVVVRDST